MDEPDVSITLTKDEALVLFGWLGRQIEDDDGRQLLAADTRESELWALNGLYCGLEKILAEPFAPDAQERFAKANARIAAGRRWSGSDD